MDEIKTENIRRCISYAIRHRISTETPIAANAELDALIKYIDDAEERGYDLACLAYDADYNFAVTFPTFIEAKKIEKTGKQGQSA